MHISQLELWSIFEKSTEFWKRLQFAPTSAIPSQCFFSGDINHLNQWYLFGHVARALAKGDRLRALLAAMRKPETEWKILKKRLRTMWTKDPEHGKWSCITNWRSVSTFTRIWGRHKTELFGVILQPRTHSGMEFANDDDDDIYDTEHRLK